MNNYIEILNKHRRIEEVHLPKVTRATEFWQSLRSDVYSALPREDSRGRYIDTIVAEVMSDFESSDSLVLLTPSGKLLKRFGKFFKHSKGFELESKYAGIIGDKLQYYINMETRPYYVDFTDVIDWENGMFGKESSCWWSQYGDSREVFTNGGGWGMRFYSSFEDTQGIGRLWVMPKYNVLLCFNTYGVSRSQASRVLKQVFDSEGVELHYKTCELYNSHNDNVPYINGDSSGGSSGAFVLYADEINLRSKYDIDCEYDDDSVICDRCGDSTDEDNISIIGDSSICDNCRSNYYSYCEHCEEYVRDSEINTLHTGYNSSESWCDDCLRNSDASQCEACDDWHENLAATDMHNVYCDSCLERRAFYCEHCEKYIEAEQETQHSRESHTYCETCESCISGDEQDSDALYDHNAESHPELIIELIMN